MSGGSFDYLYSKTLVDEDTANSLNNMLEVSLEIKSNKNMKAVLAMMMLSSYIKVLNGRFNALGDVMYAVEWYKSGDWSLDQLQAVLDEFGDEK